MVQQRNWTDSCERNSTAESCKSKNGDITYNMQEVANTVWEDVSYSILTIPYKDYCANACLDDCNCEAALFKDRTCKKQRLPLRYGRRQLSDSNIAFIKQYQTKTFTGIRGTRGYVAPEWHWKLPITVKADVYSYDIVLLEIICCRKNVDWNLPKKEAILEEWAYHCFETNEITKLLGDEKVDKKQAEIMVKLGIWYIQDEPSLRPSMKKVLIMLEGTIDIPIPPSLASFLSAI
ncbi:G-type lectin S-receptor-like serine/threonine-protein kinase LECRK2 [Corylus avellana]|uniref:G-type lectin S-receptor-like serine/threonine-protein kinase LECRK2 n=1 Tax=Corylus avellana TaxID=13451 RepID=UPI00286D68A1|nr:G-type lectin S-receptor-like serine/threonine-protein kinase LECRK2 [Corylus avellana]